ncbi:MAG: hypothetical protein ABIQ10_02735 [Gemmatimonadaceae bacterium]
MKKSVMLLLAATLLIAVACRKGDSDAPVVKSPPPDGAMTTTSTAPAGIPASLAKLTPNELKWGISPTRNAKVTYQPGVIIMEHGSDAIRAMASNGMTWTIDANAPGASDIQEDRILFATGRVMGRVLKVDHTPTGLAVTLGPVEITDVIKDCDLTSDQPIDIGSALVYTAPDYPGATTTDDPPSGAFAAPSVPVYFASSQAPVLPSDIPGIGAPKEIVLNDFHVIPVCCGGLGITLAHDGQGVKMMATAVIELTNPSVHFDLVIRGGTIYTAMVQLQGTAGFRVHFSAGTDKGISGNIKQNFFIPVDASFPIVGLGVPLSVVIRQTLRVETIFTAQTGTLEATGEYTFGGEFKAGKQNGGAWQATGPTSVTTKQNLANTLDGISMGVNGLVFAYGAKVIVGIGAFGFVTGPYVGYNTVVGVNKTSSMPGALPCRSGQLNTSLRFGVGYQMPQVVTNAINFFMHALGIKPINSEGGFEKEEGLIDKTDYVPAGCKPKEGA